MLREEDRIDLYISYFGSFFRINRVYEDESNCGIGECWCSQYK